VTGVAGALDGIRVLDLTRVLAGPLCTMTLGDMGAEVVKVEPPGGDDTRAWGPPSLGGEAAYYLGVNRNKRGIVLDLADPAQRVTLSRLMREADVIVENYKTGTLEKWGLGPDCPARSTVRSPAMARRARSPRCRDMTSSCRPKPA
jgi:formyl-CoA transferase